MKRQQEEESLRGIRVIIVEDNFSVARSLRWLLESHDCQVVGMVATQAAALALIGEVPFDVAVLDVQLGAGDVSSVATRVIAHGGHIVYVTGYGVLEMLPPELRSFPRLVKPVDPDLLLATILEAVRGTVNGSG